MKNQAALVAAAGGFEALAVLTLDPSSAEGEGGSEQTTAEELPLPYRTTG